MRQTRPWTAEETAILVERYATASVRELCALLARGAISVRRKANHLGLKNRRTLATMSIRHEYFSSVDTAKQAYVLGLLAADGYVNSKLHQLRLVLNRKDAHLVRFVRDEIAPLAPVYETGNIASLQIISHRLAADLAKFGIVAGKSYSLSWPRSLPPDLARAFLLGYFDGDGSLVRRKTKYGKMHFEWALYGLREFLADAAAVIEKQTGVRLSAPVPDKRKVALHRLSAYGKNAIRIDAWLHQDGLGLERKKII